MTSSSVSLICRRRPLMRDSALRNCILGTKSIRRMGDRLLALRCRFQRCKIGV
jgi:hypothetical protein